MPYCWSYRSCYWPSWSAWTRTTGGDNRNSFCSGKVHSHFACTCTTTRSKKCLKHTVYITFYNAMTQNISLIKESYNYELYKVNWKKREAQRPSGRALDSGARGWGCDPHSGRRVVSLSKIHLPFKSTGNTQEVVAPFRHDWKIVYWDVKQKRNEM